MSSCFGARRGCLAGFLITGAAVVVGLVPARVGACTILVASGTVSQDGRPLLVKVRDTSGDRQQLVYSPGSPYSYIGVRTEGGTVFMGLNDRGVASGNANVNPLDLPNYNSGIQTYILRNKASVPEIYSYVQAQTEQYSNGGRGSFPFIDAQGHAGIFELNAAEWWIHYDTLNLNREAQGLLGFVVRANEYHQQPDGTDDTSITGGRYEAGNLNILGLVQANLLSAKAAIQGAGTFEFLRYGPERDLATISRSSTKSAIVVHGVAPGEDPALATMWVILGQTNYGIAVPTWAAVSSIPASLASGDMYDRAKSLYAKGNEVTIQASTFPAEAHLFEMVNDVLLPHWRIEGAPSAGEATRVEHQMASDAYSLLDCLDNLRNDNKPPKISFTFAERGYNVQFTPSAHDVDGVIESFSWNFGDLNTSSAESPSHTYSAAGYHLVSCTVTDNEGVSTTAWDYLRVPFIPPDFDWDGDVDEDDMAAFVACITGPNQSYHPDNLPPGCPLAPDAEGFIEADFDRDGDVDQDDFAVPQRCLSGRNVPADPNCADWTCR